MIKEFLILTLILPIALTVREEFIIGSSKIITNELVFEIKEYIDKDNTYINQEETYIQTDIIKQFPNEKDFELQVIQGYINEPKYLNYDSKYTNYLLDNFNSEAQSGISYLSSNFSPIYNKKQFELFYEPFSNYFHLLSSPLYDRTNYIKTHSFTYLNEVIDKPCSDILDGIKNLYPKFKWKEYENDINYNSFILSSYKSIAFKVRKYSIDSTSNIFELKIRILYKESENSLTLANDKTITINRIIQGPIFSFKPFKFSNLIHINNINKIESLELYDLIPYQLEMVPSSIKLKVTCGSINMVLDRHNIDYLTFLAFKTQTKLENSNIPYSYESKHSSTLNIKFKITELKRILNECNDSVQIKYEIKLNKHILNFESVEHEYEFGYKIPCGIVLLNYDSFYKENHWLISTNQLFFNTPQVDNTMPFIIIAFTYVVYGYLFIQILNKYLESKGNMIFGILILIKERLVIIGNKLLLPILVIKDLLFKSERNN